MRKNVVSWGGNGNVVTAMDRVRTEVALMKKLRHENLVRLYEIVDCEESDALVPNGSPEASKNLG